MSVYVGIDVHRKRSKVAVVTEDGKVQLNKNGPGGQRRGSPAVSSQRSRLSSCSTVTQSHCLRSWPSPCRIHDRVWNLHLAESISWHARGGV